MKHPQHFKLLLTFITFCLLMASCQFPRYIKASDYHFNDYVNEPEIGMSAKDIWKEKNIWIYEVSTKMAKPIARSVQQYRTDSNTLYISLLYRKMMIQDDMTNDNELFPVIINKDAKIILTGWKSYDSLRLIKYFERFKSIK